MTLAARLKREFVSGWKPLRWFGLRFLSLRKFGLYVQTPDSWLAMISGISGILWWY